MLIAVVTLSGCASLPEDQPVLEQLDGETGITVTRLGKPVELYRETFLKEAAGRFAFIAPFETNQMGSRELFLWVALPVDPAPDVEPEIELDGQVLSLGKGGRDAEFAGLRKSPYRIPTPWSAMYYYRIDESLVTRLAQASRLSIGVTELTKTGTARTQFAAGIPDSRLKDFAAR